jgi:dihydrofolate reductase
MTVHLIWAEARNGVIGNEGGIPWRIPGEQATFKERTMGSTVVMGRGTWWSLPERVRPLPGRRNVVLTKADLVGVETARTVDEVLKTYDDFWVIGGGAVYAAFLPYATHLVRTEVDLDIEGDTFAPAIDDWPGTPGEWQITDSGVRWRVVEHSRAEAPRNA